MNTASPNVIIIPPKPELARAKSVQRQLRVAAYCHHSPTVYEKPLQKAILAAVNSLMSQKDVLMGQIEDAIRTELIPFPCDSMSAADLERQIGELNKEFQELFAMSMSDGGFMKYADDFKRITDDIAALKERKAVTGLSTVQTVRGSGAWSWPAAGWWLMASFLPEKPVIDTGKERFAVM